MSANDTPEKAQQLTAPSAQSSMMVGQVIDYVLEADDPLPLISRMLDELDPQKAGDAYPTVKLVLESLGSFILGVEALKKPDTYAEAGQHFQSAVDGFDQAGETELRDVAIGVGTYGAANRELQVYNISRALELVTQAREYLRKAGKYGQKFESMIDRMQPDHLFLQGVQALYARDFDKAKPLIEQASRAAEKFAQDHCEPDSVEYFFFSGYAYYFRSFYTVNRAFNDFNQFKYDTLAGEINLRGDAVQAKELLSKSDRKLPIVEILIYASEGNRELLDLFTRLAEIMRGVMDSTFKPSPQTYDDLRQRIRRANDFFGRVGADGVPMIRLCAQLADQVNNLERLAKPVPVEVPAAGPSLREKASYENFLKFQEETLQTLRQPLQQLNRWSMLTVFLVTLSVLLIIVGAAGTLFGNTQVGLLTSTSSILSSLVSSVLYFQLRQARNEVKDSRAPLLQLFKEASERFFTEPQAAAALKEKLASPERTSA